MGEKENKPTPLWKSLIFEHRLPWRYKKHLITIRIRLIRNKKNYFYFLLNNYGVGDLLSVSPIAQKIQEKGIKTICFTAPFRKDVTERIKGFDKVIAFYQKDDEFLREFRNSFYNMSKKSGEIKLKKKKVDGLHNRGYLVKSRWNGFSGTYNHATKKRFPDKSEKLIEPYEDGFDKTMGYILKKEEEDFALEYKKKNGDYLIFHTDSGAYGAGRRDWINEYWQELIDMQKLKVIIIGQPKHKFNNCINLRDLSIHKTAALIKHCKLFVGVDSGPFWIANAFKKDCIEITGGYASPELTKHEKSFHFTTKADCAPCVAWLKRFDKCPYDKKCMREIKPEQVNKKIIEVLGGIKDV